MAFAIATFAAVLAVIATERVDRTKVALIGASLVVISQTIDQEQAIHAIDFNTIGLLAGMMLMVKLTETTGVYSYLAIRAGQLSRGPLAVVASLALITAVLSALLDNLTTVLLVVPITFLLADTLDIDPIPLVIIEIIASNIGGTATLIGDPPNIMIAGATELSFLDFIANLAPIAALAFVIVTALLYRFYRSRLQIDPAARERIMRLDARRSIEDHDEARRTVPVLVLTIFVSSLTRHWGSSRRPSRSAARP
jgi:Na+/H+ antiporter NhaD/arsenite permease-like protein